MKQLDFDRIYAPIGLSQSSIDNQEVIDELMALLNKRKEDLMARDQKAIVKDPDSDN